MIEPVIKTEDYWQREATAQAVASARYVIQGGSINNLTRVSSLSEIELGWIICAAIFGWIESKAKQAAVTTNGKSRCHGLGFFPPGGGMLLDWLVSFILVLAPSCF